MATRRRTIVGSPLTPGLLTELGGFGELPPAPNGFAPDGAWSHTYRVWVCHGYRETGNKNVGFLKIERAPDKAEGTFTLNVEQQIVHMEGVLNTVRAEIACLNDQLGSPIRWHLSSRFIGQAGKPRPALDVEERARINGDTVEVTANGRTFKREGSSRLTADWCLFEAVQRLPFDGESRLACDVLEGLSTLRTGHRLSYRGKVRLPPGDDTMLHGFHRLGHGALPYEYWLDERHRLVMVVTLSRVYILDGEAEQKTALELRRERSNFQRQKRARERGPTQ